MNVKVWPHKKGDGGLLCLPLVRNIPDAGNSHSDWKKVTCTSCGSACWESDTHRNILEQEKDIKAACTMCALRLG